MAWMIQPHNWVQAVRPNFYNVGYKRNEAYKGMGAPYNRYRGMGQIYRPGTVPLARYISTGMGQVSCDANGQNCVDISNLPIAGYSGGVTPTSLAMSNLETQAAAQTLQQQTSTNWLPWIIGGFVVLALLGGRR